MLFFKFQFFFFLCQFFSDRGLFNNWWHYIFWWLITALWQQFFTISWIKWRYRPMIIPPIPRRNRPHLTIHWNIRPKWLCECLIFTIIILFVRLKGTETLNHSVLYRLFLTLFKLFGNVDISHVFVFFNVNDIYTGGVAFDWDHLFAICLA